LKLALTILVGAVLLLSNFATVQAGIEGNGLRVYEFNGIVEFVDDPSGLIDVLPGDPFHGSFIYDLAEPDFTPDPNVGTYRYLASSLHLDEHSYGSGPAFDDCIEDCIGVAAFPDFSELFTISSPDQTSGPPLSPALFIVDLIDDNGGALPNDGLPPVTPDLSQFEIRDFLFFAGEGVIDGDVIIEQGDSGFEISVAPTQIGGVFISGIITSIAIRPPLVGGELLPLDTTALLLTGAQMNAAWMIPIIVSAIGIGIVIARKF